MKCSNCGKENAPGVRFCAECGTVMPEETAQQTQQSQQPMQAPPVQSYTQPQANGTQNVSPEYKPISMWGYFGYEILFAIPCVGLILLLVFSFGGTQNQNLKNFARSYFCLLIVVVVLVLIFAITGGAAMLGSMSRYY